MKHWFLASLLLICSNAAVQAQRNLEGLDEPRFRDRVYYGGGGSFQLTQDIILIGVSPIMGYMITDRWSSGVGVTYQYIHYKFFARATHTYGGRLFTRYNVFRSVFTMAEYESLNIELMRHGSDLPRVWADRLLIGGGYFQPFAGGRGGFNIGVFYDFLYMAGNRHNPYNSPWVYRVGFTF